MYPHVMENIQLVPRDQNGSNMDAAVFGDEVIIALLYTH